MDDSGFQRRRCIFFIVVKLLVQAAVALVLFYLWATGCIFIAFALRHKGLPALHLTLFSLGPLLCSAGLLWKRRMLRRVSYAMMLTAVLCAGATAFRYWWTEGRFPVVGQQVAYWEYQPFSEGNRLVEIAVPAELRLEGDDIPKMDGAYALYPVYAALAQAMFPEGLAKDFKYVGLNGSDEIYRKLLAGECDMIFALAPSKLQLAEAEKAGLSYEMTPFGRDAFVFYVNARNPVEGLSTEQIRGIHSGRITNWRQIHGNFDEAIVAFQRNEGSGSQTTLQRLMGETPIMPPLKEDRVGGMGEIINDTANYRNSRSALGFSFRYYATELLRYDKIKLLPIDGVAPTAENIQNGSYPHVATAYVVTVRPRTDNMRKIVDLLLSHQGQELVEKTGYVPVGKPSLTEAASTESPKEIQP